MNKVPFDILEVGCKYESRCGEIWDVLAKRGLQEETYPFVVRTGRREVWLSKDGRYNVNERDHRDDLIYKLVESGVSSSDASQDAINPSHYKHNGIETIDYMKAVSTKDEFKGHLRLTAIKYISRLGKKDCPKQEIKKAIWYLNKLLEEYEAESNE